MKNVIILIRILLNKSLLFTISFLIGWVGYLLFNDLTTALVIGTMFFVLVYFFSLGPLGMVEKESLIELEQHGVINTCLSPYDKSINFKDVDCKMWKKGLGEINSYELLLRVQIISSGIVFHTLNFPERPILFIKWNVIHNVIGGDYSKSENPKAQIVLKDNSVIHLPITEQQVKMFHLNRNKKGNP